MDKVDMREILIIARNFPPYNDKGRAGVGYVIRVLKFCKYLPSFGFKPVVVTVDKNPARKIEPQKDPLLEEISATTEIHYVADHRLIRYVDHLSSKKKKLKRVRKRSLAYWIPFLWVSLLSGLVKNLFHVIKKRVLVPDEGLLWNRTVETFCSRLIQKRNIRCLMTISPPNSTHLVGVALKKRFELKWCADFKDAWIGNPLFSTRSSARNEREERQEKTVLEHADIVTSVNDPSVDLLKSHTEERATQRFETIYNGFDPDELNVPPHPYDRKTINIIHCGVVYPYRTLGPFLHVLTQRVEKGDPFRVYLLGQIEDRNCFDFRDRYPEVVHLEGVASRSKTISMIKGADVTLLLISAGDSFAPLSGKIFEYLACDKRIIGLVPEGIARDFIQASHMGWTCDLQDKERIDETLGDVCRMWKEGSLPVEYPRELKSRYDRKVSTGQLVNLFLEQD